MLSRLEARGWTLGVAESLTGGLIGAAHRQRPGREPDVPGFGRVVRNRGEAIGARASPRSRWSAASARSRWPRRAAGARRGRRHRRDRRRRSGRAGRSAGRARCGSRSRCPASRWKRCRPGCPAIASASGSSPRSRCSTSCGCGSTRCHELSRAAARVPRDRSAAGGARRDRLAARAAEVVAVRVDPPRAVAHHVAVLRPGRRRRSALSEGIRPRPPRRAPARLRVRGGGAFPSPKQGAGLLARRRRDRRARSTSTRRSPRATRDFIDRRDRIALKPHLTLARLKRSDRPDRRRRSPRRCRPSARPGRSPSWSCSKATPSRAAPSTPNTPASPSAADRATAAAVDARRLDGRAGGEVRRGAEDG